MLHHIYLYLQELFQILHFTQHFQKQEICLEFRWEVHLEKGGKVQINKKYCAVHDSNTPALREILCTLQQMRLGKFLLFFTNESDRKI